jgi:hypothetical protein
MPNDHPTIEVSTEFTDSVVLDYYPHETKERIVETSVSYDGEVFCVDCCYAFSDEIHDSNKWDQEGITTFGWRHANLVICSLLALLEAYGQPHLLNDADIQEDFSRMVQETKNSYAEKAFEQIRNGLKRE